MVDVVHGSLAKLARVVHRQRPLAESFSFTALATLTAGFAIATWKSLADVGHATTLIARAQEGQKDDKA